MKFKGYTNEVRKYIDEKYTDLIENIFAHDVAYDLSDGIRADRVYLERSKGIDRYNRNNKRSKEIFTDLYNYMKSEKEIVE